MADSLKEDVERLPEAGEYLPTDPRLVCGSIPTHHGTRLQIVKDLPTAAWPWRVGLMLDSVLLLEELMASLQEMGAERDFQVRASASVFEAAGLVERQRPDVLFVELASVPGTAAEWIGAMRGGKESPLVVAVSANADPAEMIGALRAGASEFLSCPLRPGIFEALDRIGTQLEARQTSSGEPGRLTGILSSKGGCGATTIACHLAAALSQTDDEAKVLMADLDCQSPSVNHVYRLRAEGGSAEAFHSVRRLNSNCWPEFAQEVAPSVDMLAGTLSAGGMPEAWRIDNLFRFVRRHYTHILADLGRHLTPSNWSFLPQMDEVLIVTAPDVPALYQTRSVLQMLHSRGFDKGKVRLILNRNQDAPQDFWIESIEQMFDMSVTGVLPYDATTLSRMSREQFRFPANSPFGRAVTKLAQRLTKPAGAETRARARKPA